MEDIEDIYGRLANKYEKIFSPENASYAKPGELDLDKYKAAIAKLLEHEPPIDIHVFKRNNQIYIKNSFVFQTYLNLVSRGDFEGSREEKSKVAELLKIKKGKSSSGVIVITIFTSPYPHGQNFSCAWNCSFCPKEPDMPKSYLSLEPGVMRAKRANFDCATQMWERMKGLYVCGHIEMDKLEVLVLGGTISSYPKAYVEEFCRDIYYAANTFWELDRREIRLSLEEEKKLNKKAQVKIIGLTLETRPDCVTPKELILFRKYGVTRVQLGIQHTDDEVLKKNNRGCSREDAMKAIKLLKDSCFKVDTHFMPNLPGSSPEKDLKMFVDELLDASPTIPRRDFVYGGYEWERWTLTHPDIQSDQWKIYPCMVTPWTDIEKWYREGTYKPYPLEELQDVLLRTKALIFPWIRINRLVRDISGDYFIDDVSKEMGAMRETLEGVLRKEGKRCACIRCREPKDANWNGEYIIRIREYNASEGQELFIAAESADEKIVYGFVRLRFPRSKWTTDSPFDVLSGLALIRELHVYGKVAGVDKKVIDNTNRFVQHRGIGKRLMGIAEDIAFKYGWKGLAVISGEGVRGYYEKLGFIEDDSLGWFMIKTRK